MGWLLTDEDFHRESVKVKVSFNNMGMPWFWEKQIAKAQAKKLAKWLEKNDTWSDWLALRKELGLK